jgi:hypothetical protein
MDLFDIKGVTQKLIGSRNGVSTKGIIGYLDYLNKIQYSEDEIILVLMELSNENKVKSKDQLWYNA